jgi:LacI family transcriptional regulator
MKITLEFIADKAKVSKSLVSKVLNDKSVRISKEKREQILNLAKKYNYEPNRMAAGLRKQKTNMLALILPTLYFDFFSKLAYSVESSARKSNYNILICNTDEDLFIERQYLSLYRSGMIDGIIVSPSDNSANLNIMEAMNSEGFPMVFVDRYIDNLKNSFVTTDSYYGAYTATEKLIMKGHKKICFLSHTKSPNTSVQIDRYSGYFDAVIKYGLEGKRIWIPNEFDFAKQLLHNILLNPDRPTALVLVTSWDINPLLHTCYELGLSIPNDIEVAAFDKFSIPYSSSLDMKIAQNLIEPLIIVEQDPIEMGCTAVDILLGQIESKDMSRQRIFLKPNILSNTVSDDHQEYLGA